MEDDKKEEMEMTEKRKIMFFCGTTEPLESGGRSLYRALIVLGLTRPGGGKGERKTGAEGAAGAKGAGGAGGARGSEGAGRTGTIIS